MPTYVVTLIAGSDAGKTPPVTVTASFSAMSSLAEVTKGVIEAGAVPPAIVIGKSTAAVVSLMATTTTVPSGPREAKSMTFERTVPVIPTMLWLGRMNLLN